MPLPTYTVLFIEHFSSSIYFWVFRGKPLPLFNKGLCARHLKEGYRAPCNIFTLWTNDATIFSLLSLRDWTWTDRYQNFVLWIALLPEITSSLKIFISFWEKYVTSFDKQMCLVYLCACYTGQGGATVSLVIATVSPPQFHRRILTLREYRISWAGVGNFGSVTITWG